MCEGERETELHGTVSPLRPALARCAQMDLIIDSLEQPPDRQGLGELIAAIRATHDAVMPLLKPNVREHNWQRLTRVFDSFGSEVRGVVGWGVNRVFDSFGSEGRRGDL